MVLFDVDTLRDLTAQFDYLAPGTGEQIAWDYLAELHGYCLGFGTFPERGTLREDLRPGLRLINYRCRATIALAWISRNRRLWKGTEATLTSATAFLYAASVMILIRRRRGRPS